MVANIEVNKVADMEVNKVADMVADMEVDKVADMFKTKCIQWNVLKRSVSCRSCFMRSLPDLRVHSKL